MSQIHFACLLGSGQTETPDDLTESSKPDILEDIREKGRRLTSKLLPLFGS